LTWASGLNRGASMEVKSVGSSTISLALPMANDVSIGDTFTISSGCDKNFDSPAGCSSFILSPGNATTGNQINFRGYPHIPGMDKVMEYPNAK
jgi:hypothetical protein